MKRIFAVVFCILITGALLITCSAAYVRTDKALSEKETSYIETLFNAIKKSYGIEAFFIINYDYTGGEEFRTYARKFLDDNKSSDDSMIFAVSSDNYYMNTRGNAGNLLTDEDIDTLYDAIADADENGEQYKAAVKFYAELNKILSKRVGAAKSTEPASQKAEQSAAEKTQEETTERVILPGSVPIPDEISPVRGDRLVDQADLLSDEAEKALQEKLDAMSERLQFDVVIVTAEHIGTRTPMEFADDYFDYNGFGYGKDYDGVALLVSMEERDWWISTCGYGLTALSDDYFMKFISPSDFTYNLKKGNYEKSFNFFADTVGKFVTEAKENEPYSQKHRFHTWSSMRTGLIWSVIFGLAAAGITVYYKYDNYTGFVHAQGEAGNYLVGGVNITEKSDVFRYKNISHERRAVKTESTSSGSSTRSSGGRHVSSSGRTHGGGGGKF